MSSPEFSFYSSLPKTVSNVIRHAVSENKCDLVEKLLNDKPPAFLAEFKAWKTSIECFMTHLPSEIRNVVNSYVSNEKFDKLRQLVYASKVTAAINEFEKWAFRNRIPLEPTESNVPKNNNDLPPLHTQAASDLKFPLHPGFSHHFGSKIIRRTLTIPGKYMGSVLGKGKQKIEQIKQLTGVTAMISTSKPTTAPVQITVQGYDRKMVRTACIEIYNAATSLTAFKRHISDMSVASQVSTWDDQQTLAFAMQFSTFLDKQSPSVIGLRSFDAVSLNTAFKELFELYGAEPVVAKPTSPAQVAPKKKKKKNKNTNKTNFNRPIQEVTVSQKIQGLNLKDNTNILILGATGVGKSTFLNSIANYFAFGENYKQARKDLNVIIGMKYDKYDIQQNGVEVVLTPRNNDDADNENKEDGESCTIDPRCHSFRYKVNGKEKFVRIIDTPGLCDTAGVERDSENMKKILFYLKNFPDLHAICILMKPSESRSTVAFRYYINEILKQLHKDAAKNILHLFAHTNGTNFTPGDTLTPLNTILTEVNQAQGLSLNLSKENMFCFDNDGFRYFAAQKFAGFPITSEEPKALENWTKSAQETERFLKAVSKLPSYNVGKTLAIYQARDTLRALAEPMAEKTRSIFLNKRSIKEAIAEIKQLSKDGADLEKRLHYENKQYQKVPVSTPRVVCKACAEPVGKGVELLRVCHNNCHCIADHVPMGQTPDVKLCTVFSDDLHRCNECGCPWNAHERFNYEVVEFTTSVVDVAVQGGMGKKEAQVAAAKEFVEKLEEENKRLDGVLRMLRKQSAAFSAFVKKESIVYTNDSFIGYIDICINGANYSTSKQDLTQNLKEFKATYEQELALYNTSGKSKEQLTVENITEKLEELLNNEDLGVYLSSIKEFLEETADPSMFDQGWQVLGGLFGKMTI